MASSERLDTSLLTPADDGAADALSTAGGVAAIFGALGSAIGGFYQAQAQQSELGAQASWLDFQAELSQINARGFEEEAQSITEAAQNDIALLSLRAGQVKGAQRASIGARGIRHGVGSAAEVIASTELTKQIDALTINANAVRAAGVARQQKVNAENSGLLSRVSAGNLRRTSRSINPLLSATSSLLDSASTIGNQYGKSNYRRR